MVPHITSGLSLLLLFCCDRYLIMAGWAGSTMVWVTYDRYLNGPPPDALSVRFCALSAALFLSLHSTSSLFLLTHRPCTSHRSLHTVPADRTRCARAKMHASMHPEDSPFAAPKHTFTILAEASGKELSRCKVVRCMIPNATHADLPARHLNALMGGYPASIFCLVPTQRPPSNATIVMLMLCSYVRAWLPNTATTDRLHYIPHICRRDAGWRCGGAVARCTIANHECNCGVEGPCRLDVSDNSVTALHCTALHCTTDCTTACTI